MADAIPGWQVERAGARDLGRRPAIDLIADALRIYRSRARPILVFAAVLQGTATLVTLPYLASQWQVVQRESLATASASLRLDERGAVLAGAVGGAMTSVSIVSLGLLSALLAVMVFAPDRDPIRHPLAELDRRWRTILPIILAVVFACVAFGAITAGLSWPLDNDPAALDPARAGVLSLGLLVVTLGAGAVLVYASLRWAVAIPAFIVEAFGIRASINRSSALTRRRLGHVALVIIASCVAVGLVALVPLGIAGGILWLGAGGTGAAILAGTLYVVGQVLVAPVSPLVMAILYRDLREAGTAPG